MRSYMPTVVKEKKDRKHIIFFFFLILIFSHSFSFIGALLILRLIFFERERLMASAFGWVLRPGHQSLAHAQLERSKLWSFSFFVKRLPLKGSLIHSVINTIIHLRMKLIDRVVDDRCNQRNLLTFPSFKKEKKENRKKF